MGGVPDPAAKGPSWIQIGTEGGVLPNVSVIPPAPIAYETGMRSVTVTNMSSHGLLLMSAERADAIVDFTLYAGKTLILYNDAPAPAPAHDDRYDYYTGDPDFTGSGGAPTTLAGFGPNTRTIMQVVVNSSVLGASEPAVDLTALKAAIPAAFNISQPPPVVPESTYSAAYGQTMKDVFPRLQSTSLTFTPIDPSTKKLALDQVTGLPIVVTLPLRMKTIQELFELDYGRMNATLGTELPLTNFNTQTTIPLGYIDPFTEDIYDSSNLAASPVGVGADGSQIWMVVHNGVDSHAIHFHLYDVQLIDRFGWDGTTRIPFPDELGWKDTVRMNPLEIDFVALRPMRQTLPFPVPDSARLFDVTKPAGSDLSMSAFDPFNNAAPQINQVQPMGWEYVWHCHLLGHEENDMMRDQVFQVTPETPANVAVRTVGTSTRVNQVIFKDMSLSEAGFNIQRTTLAGGSLRTVNVPAKAGWGGTVSWNDNVADTTTTKYKYQVRSYKPDANYWTPLIGPLYGANIGIPATLPNLTSPWSGVATVAAAPAIVVSPTSLTFSGTQAYLTTSAPLSVTVTSAGAVSLLVSLPSITGTNASDFAVTTTCPINPSPLASTATCTVSVTFKPTYAGTRTANLVIPSNDPVAAFTTIPLTGTGGKVPLTITAPSQSYVWTQAGVPTLGAPTVAGLANGDTVAVLAITCSTTYKAGGLPGTYPTSCVAASNPSNAYTISYVSGTLTVTAATATMISPVPGSTLTGSTVTFTWTTWPGATQYDLQVATSPGLGNIFSRPTTGNSLTVTNIPITGQTLYVRLMTMLSTGWQVLDYTYIAPAPVPAAMISPTPGSTLHAGTATFTWSAGLGIQQYQVLIGNAPGNTTYANSLNTTATSFTATTLPKNNSTIYVRLISRTATTTYFVDYTYIAAP